MRGERWFETCSAPAISKFAHFTPSSIVSGVNGAIMRKAAEQAFSRKGISEREPMEA